MKIFFVIIMLFQLFYQAPVEASSAALAELSKWLYYDARQLARNYMFNDAAAVMKKALLLGNDDHQLKEALSEIESLGSIFLGDLGREISVDMDLNRLERAKTGCEMYGQISGLRGAGDAIQSAVTGYCEGLLNE